MLKANLESLVEVSVQGTISHPLYDEAFRFETDSNGYPFIPVGFSGITYNVKIGDPAFGWACGDHIEPGVSISNPDRKANAGLNLLTCLGNEATVITTSLDSKETQVRGTTGVVTGKHGGAERIIIHFPQKVLDNLCIGDKIQIRACGVGLKMPSHPDITIMNCSPTLFKAINPSEKGNKVRIQVAKVIPGKIMGSGIGSTNPFKGDYDIQSSSPEIIKEYSLDTLRIGDLVAITDHDCTYGPHWQDKAITIGAVIHGASNLAGHGPGVAPLFTTSKSTLDPIITRKANIANLLGLN